MAHSLVRLWQDVALNSQGLDGVLYAVAATRGLLKETFQPNDNPFIVCPSSCAGVVDEFKTIGAQLHIVYRRLTSCLVGLHMVGSAENLPHPLPDVIMAFIALGYHTAALPDLVLGIERFAEVRA